MKLRDLIYGKPSTIAGTTYGTIVVLATITVGGQAYVHHLWDLVALVGVTAIVLWIAHTYSNGLGQSISEGHRLTFREFATIARKEFAIPLSAVLPILALCLGAIGAVSGATTVWIALGIGMFTLAVQGVRYADLEEMTPAGRAITIGVNLGIGLIIVGLKATVAH